MTKSPPFPILPYNLPAVISLKTVRLILTILTECDSTEIRLIFGDQVLKKKILMLSEIPQNTHYLRLP